jgi:hypothetical protein
LAVAEGGGTTGPEEEVEEDEEEEEEAGTTEEQQGSGTATLLRRATTIVVVGEGPTRIATTAPTNPRRIATHLPPTAAGTATEDIEGMEHEEEWEEGDPLRIILPQTTISNRNRNRNRRIPSGPILTNRRTHSNSSSRSVQQRLFRHRSRTGTLLTARTAGQA